VPFYVEFPADPVVNVSWKKKDKPPDEPDPGDYRNYCGAFQNGVLHGVPVGFTGVYVLAPIYLYMMIVDNNPGHLPTKPYMYFPCFNDYNWFMPTHKAPYIWTSPRNWTLTNRSPTLPGATRIKEYRNVNVQRFLTGTTTAPDRIGGETMDIEPQHGSEIYPPFVMCEIETALGWQPQTYPHLFVQAHCAFTTLGAWWGGTDNDAGTPAACMAMLPPQPVGWGTFFDPASLVQYPAPGSTADPVRPPLGARRTDIRRPPGPLPERVFELEA